MSQPCWEEHLILRVVSGSRAYGLATPASDTDTRGVCFPPRAALLGLGRFEQHESSGGDHVIYALGKFVRLALQGNPNLIEILFTPDEHVLDTSPAGERLRAAREDFLSQRLAERFLGYARGQRKRMEGHRPWLSDPPREPRPEEFGGWLEAGKLSWPRSEAQVAYQAAQREFAAYARWVRERNPQRAELERAHGYDTKHAMHLCRLLRMAEEALLEGVVRVTRPDAEWLLGVRRGELSYAELVSWVAAQTARVEAARERSRLPPAPRQERVEQLLIELHEDYLASLRS